MKIYIGVTILSCIIYYILNKLWKKRTTLKVFVALLPMFIVSAIRYNVGWDYLQIYTNGFYMIGEGFMPHYFSERPFCWLVNAIYIISNENPYWLFIVCSAITFIFLSKAIKEQSVNVVFSIILVFCIRYYFLTLNIVRQGIAMSIILCSLRFIKEKNFKRYLFMIILASCFHLVSLIYIPIYFICQIDWRKKKNTIVAFLIPLLAIMLYALIVKFTKYGVYLEASFRSNNLLLHEIMLSGVILLIATVERKNIEVGKEYFNIYYILQVITFIIAICSKFLPLADRIVWLFYIQNIFLVPIIMKNVKSVSKKTLLIIFILTVMSINIYAQAVLTDSYSIIPYHTIFSQ